MKLITKKLNGCNQSTHHNNLSPLLSGDGEQTAKLAVRASCSLLFTFWKPTWQFQLRTYLRSKPAKEPSEAFNSSTCISSVPQEEREYLAFHYFVLKMLSGGSRNVLFLRLNACFLAELELIWATFAIIQVPSSKEGCNTYLSSQFWH